jgi:hypothetical protein
MIFDVQHHDGEPVRERPYRERRALLEQLELDGPAWRVPASFAAAGTALLEATAAQGVEGIVLKRPDARWRPGRSNRGHSSAFESGTQQCMRVGPDARSTVAAIAAGPRATTALSRGWPGVSVRRRHDERGGVRCAGERDLRPSVQRQQRGAAALARSARPAGQSGSATGGSAHAAPSAASAPARMPGPPSRGAHAHRAGGGEHAGALQRSAQQGEAKGALHGADERGRATSRARRRSSPSACPTPAPPGRWPRARADVNSGRGGSRAEASAPPPPC